MPSPAIIVGGVVITCGAIYVFTEYGWPHVEPKAREFAEEIKNWWERTKQRHGVAPHSNYSRSPSPFDDSEETKRHSFHSSSTSSDDESTAVFQKSARLHESVEMRRLVKDETTGWANQDSQIRRRKTNKNELGVAGLPLYDEPNPFSSYKPIMPTSVGTQQNRVPSPPADIDPFRIADEEDDNVKTPATIPLPLSPESSAVLPTHSKGAGQVSSDEPHMTIETLQHYQPMVPSPLISNLTPASPPQPHSSSPQPVPLSSDRLDALHQQLVQEQKRQQQQPQQSHARSASSSSLSPPPVLGGSSGVRSPENARATSPSGISDTMSMVSAAPSRTWTDGGTAEIFSGSEKDFQGNDSDGDDVESVSDTGSWENVSPEVTSPPPGAVRRLSRQ